MRFCQSLMFSSPDDWVELTRVAEAGRLRPGLAVRPRLLPGQARLVVPLHRPTAGPCSRPRPLWPDVWVMTGALAAVDRAHHVLDPRLRAAGPQPVRGGQGGGDRRLPVRRPGAARRGRRLDARGVHPARAALRPPGRPHGGADRGAPHPVAGRHGRAPRRVLRLRPAGDVPGPAGAGARSSSAATARPGAAPGRPDRRRLDGRLLRPRRAGAATSSAWPATAGEYGTDGPAVRGPGLGRRPAADPRGVRRAGGDGRHHPHHLGLDDGGPARSPRAARTCGRWSASARCTSPRCADRAPTRRAAVP